MRSVIVETERLRLREMTYDDADAILAVFSDKDSVKYYPYEFNEERSRFWIFCNLKRYAVFSFGTWAVELKETGELIGDRAPRSATTCARISAARAMRLRRQEPCATGHLSARRFRSCIPI